MKNRSVFAASAPAGTGADAAAAATREQARRIEQASLRAWPALSDSDFDGWRLRFADGYTRRANSITPLEPSRLALQDKITTCERLYAERGLPTIFRLTPFAPAELDELLATRGYRSGDRVEVRARVFATAPPLPPRHVSGRLRVHGVDAWLDIFERLSSASPSNRAAHRAVLTAVPPRRRLLALAVDDQPVACGMGVLTDSSLGLFDLVTSPLHRNRGYGSELLRRALLWGEQAGAAEAYLQVLERNATAKRIYDRLSFQLIYRYHYREKAASPPRRA